MKINDNDLYTTVEQSRLIQPIMDRLEIDPDAHYRLDLDNQFYKDLGFITEDSVLSYRLDKIQLALPEWVFNVVEKIGTFQMAQEICVGAEICTESGFLEEHSSWLIEEMVIHQGCKAIEAAAELLVLLDEYEVLDEYR